MDAAAKQQCVCVCVFETANNKKYQQIPSDTPPM